MLLLLVLSLLIFEGHAYSPPRFDRIRNSSYSKPQKCIKYLNRNYECKQRPSLDEYISSVDAYGNTMGLTIEDISNARRTYVVQDIVEAMCSYFMGVSACMKVTDKYLKKYCSEDLYQVAQSYQKLTSAICPEIAADIKAMIQCANKDNSILVTYASCMYGAYHYMLVSQNFGRDQCSMIQRFRDCFYQFEDCPKQMITWNMIHLFDDYLNDICFMLRQIKGQTLTTM